MHRLEITGATPDDLYFNVVKTLSIFLRGATASVSSPQETSELAVAAPEEITRVEGSIPSGSDKEVAAKPKRGRTSNKASTAELNDEIPDLTGGADKTIEHKALTLDDDIRPRLRAIQKACTERGMDMAASVNYIMKLYGPFGVQKAVDLKPAQFAEFLEASEAYLSGEA